MTLLAQYQLRYENEEFQKRCKMAATRAAVDVLNDGGAPASRTTWANSFTTSDTDLNGVKNSVAGNATIQTDYETAVDEATIDSDTQFVVNSYINAKYV